MLYYFWDTLVNEMHFWDVLAIWTFFKHQTLDLFASFGGKIKSSQSVSSPCEKVVFILIEFIFYSIWAIKASTKRKPSLEHVGESLRISDVCSSKLLTTKGALGICLSSLFLIEQTHLKLSSGWSDLATSI